jgi:hypothetical protein
MIRLSFSFAICLWAVSLHPVGGLPALEEVVNARRDLWGDAALRQTNGPCYEFFKDLLPPPRYVNADFRYYPIVLSTPGSKVKARLISNGSALNARGGTRSWHDVGVPVTFRVGPDELRFGEFPDRLEGPRFLEGYLPIVQIDYAHGEAVYRQEAFASVAPEFATNCVVFVSFSLLKGSNGIVAAQVDEAKADSVVRFDGNWKWTRQRLVATVSPKRSVHLAIATVPKAGPGGRLDAAEYGKQRQAAIEFWKNAVGSGMQLEIPEPIVQNAWRALVCANLTLINDDRMHYSAGNQYDRLYQGEGCDAVQSLIVWNTDHDLLRRLLVSQLDFTRKGLEYHQAGHKLQILAEYFWRTRDAEFLKAQRPRWQKELDRILNERTNGHGLFRREQYCGDVATPVFSLNSNAKAWRAIRDFAAVLETLDEPSEAARIRASAEKFRRDILVAVEESIRRDVQPPFIPIAMLGEENSYSPITGTKIGSYWNLMANYVLGSRVFGPNSERERWLLNYVEEHGGLCMGMIRSRPNPTFWTGPHSINPLYGLRRTLMLLERDEPEKALLSFYGMLAQGFTRDTFISGEGCSLTPLDEGGRLFYCPPNSAANAFFLCTLRNLLVQDLDLDDDGRPETLRLCFATPRRWLENGNEITVRDAPTAFGNVSLSLQSRLAQGKITAQLSLPITTTRPKRALIRFRLPDGWQVSDAQAHDHHLPVDDTATVDISTLTGTVSIHASVKSTGH